MRVLADANLAELDPSLRDVYGYTPDQCFKYDRDDVCVSIRESFEVEQEAWHTLLRSACAQNDVDPATFGLITETTNEDLDQEDRHSENGEDEDSDQNSFVDAEE